MLRCILFVGSVVLYILPPTTTNPSPFYSLLSSSIWETKEDTRAKNPPPSPPLPPPPPPPIPPPFIRDENWSQRIGGGGPKTFFQRTVCPSVPPLCLSLSPFFSSVVIEKSAMQESTGCLNNVNFQRFRFRLRGCNKGYGNMKKK